MNSTSNTTLIVESEEDSNKRFIESLRSVQKQIQQFLHETQSISNVLSLKPKLMEEKKGILIPKSNKEEKIENVFNKSVSNSKKNLSLKSRARHFPHKIISNNFPHERITDDFPHEIMFEIRKKTTKTTTTKTSTNITSTQKPKVKLPGRYKLPHYHSEIPNSAALWMTIVYMMITTAFIIFFIFLLIFIRELYKRKAQQEFSDDDYRQISSRRFIDKEKYIVTPEQKIAKSFISALDDPVEVECEYKDIAKLLWYLAQQDIADGIMVYQPANLNVILVPRKLTKFDNIENRKNEERIAIKADNVNPSKNNEKPKSNINSGKKSSMELIKQKMKKIMPKKKSKNEKNDNEGMINLPTNIQDNAEAPHKALNDDDNPTDLKSNISSLVQPNNANAVPQVNDQRVGASGENNFFEEFFEPCHCKMCVIHNCKSGPNCFDNDQEYSI